MVERLVKLAILGAVLCILAVVAWGRTKAFLDTYFRRGSVQAPDFVGLPFAEVQRTAPAGFHLQIEREVFHDRLPAGVVVAQEPPAGLPVQKDATFALRVSKGGDFLSVPALTGRRLREARLALQEAQFRLGHLAAVSSRTIERGCVMAQYPAPGARQSRHGPVDFLVSDGSQEKLVPMPRLVGLPRDRALAVLASLGLAKVNVVERPTSASLATLVLEQRPAAGLVVPRDQPVAVTVSAPAGTAGDAKNLEVAYEVPPGLTEKLLEVAVADRDGRRVVYRRRHMPGEQAKAKISGRGALTVQYFLDKVLVKEEKF